MNMNISTAQIDFEATKDMDFNDLVGNGRPSSMANDDAFEAAQEFKRLYKQPNIFDISNNRGFTDRMLMPTHYDFDEAQKYAVEEQKAKNSFVQVSDKEIEEARKASLNGMSQGDAVSLVLQTKLNEYNGLESEDYDDFTEKGAGHIIEALYCAHQKTTFYFLR